MLSERLRSATTELNEVTFQQEIERHSLTRCYYVYLNCPQCGELREAISEMPTERFLPCPVCQREVDYTFMGNGGTARSVPFWERAARHFANSWLTL